ncbi:MAG TPA: class A beta-lactamase [Drouetiella sp.]
MQLRFSRAVTPILLSLLLSATALNGALASSPPECLKALTLQKGLGRLGISVLDLDKGQWLSLHGEERFPLQSVFKFPLAVTVLQMVDSKQLSLDKKVVLKRKDLAVLYSPLAANFKGEQQTYTIRDLIESSVQLSDNTACDVLLDQIGGTVKVNESIKKTKIEGLRVDRYERQLQPDILALPRLEPPGATNKAKWNAEVATATGPAAQKAFDFYLHEDERDMSTPHAMAAYLEEFYRGNLLSPASTKFLMDVMSGTKTGAARIRAGLPSGAKLAHKTGTGPSLKGVYSGTNDVGIATLPSGRRVAIAVFLSGSRLSEAKQDAAIRDATKCAIEHL